MSELFKRIDPGIEGSENHDQGHQQQRIDRAKIKTVKQSEILSHIEPPSLRLPDPLKNLHESQDEHDARNQPAPERIVRDKISIFIVHGLPPFIRTRLPFVCLMLRLLRRFPYRNQRSMEGLLACTRHLSIAPIALIHERLQRGGRPFSLTHVSPRQRDAVCIQNNDAVLHHVCLYSSRTMHMDKYVSAAP